jgi:hypothetical protein
MENLPILDETNQVTLFPQWVTEKSSAHHESEAVSESEEKNFTFR